MKDGYFFAEFSPDPFNPKVRFPWCRVTHKHPAGQETVIFDFLKGSNANKIAIEMNRNKHDG